MSLDGLLDTFNRRTAITDGTTTADPLIIAIKFHPYPHNLDTQASEDVLKVFQNGFCESTSAIFGCKDSMHGQVEDAGPAMSDFMVMAHGPADD